MSFLRIRDCLPDLARFFQRLAADYQQGKLDIWAQFAERVRNFYDPATMEKIETWVPGWSEMASHANGQTLIHVSSVMAALLLRDEYQQAPNEQQALLEWAVMFHDIAKVPQPGRHDYLHGFRSAACTGKALAGLQFPVTEDYSTQIASWAELTHNAVRYVEALQEQIQDNSKLPQIVSGIETLFGARSLAHLVIVPILLHLSIATSPEYPTVAPLSDQEIRQFVARDNYDYMRTLMLVDVQGWGLYDAEMSARETRHTLNAFDRIRDLIEMP